MKKYAIAVFAIVLSVAVGHYALGTESPFPGWLSKTFHDLSIGSKQKLTNEGNQAKRVAHAYYNFSLDGGGTVGTAVGLGVSLPAYAMVTRAFYRVRTLLAAPGVDAGGGTLVGVYCEDLPSNNAMNIIASALSTSFTAGKNGEGIATGAASLFTESINADCELKLYTSTHTLTGGAMDVFVEYVASAN